MNSSAQELPTHPPMETPDGPFPLGGIIGTWFAIASFYFIMSLAAMGDGFFDSETPLSNPWQLGLIPAAMTFAVTWGIVAYFASQRRAWAIRCGFWLSILSLLPILWMMAVLPLIELARQGEWLYVGCVSVSMILMAALTVVSSREQFSFVQSSTTVIYGIYLIYLPMVLLLFIAICRYLTFAPHLANGFGDIAGILGSFPLFLQVWPRYCVTCRELRKTHTVGLTSIS